MLSALLLAALLPLASATPTPSLNSQPSTLNLPSPAPADTQCSSLTRAPDGTLHLTYYGPAPANSAPNSRTLWHATLAPNATAFSTPRPIVTTPLLMENWADFATLAVGTDGALTAQWFQKSGPDAHGYEGWFSRSSDGGRTWRTPARLGHEFVALAPLSQGRTLAVWLESTRVRDPHAAPRPKRDPNAPRPAKDPNAPYAPSMKLLARLLAPDGTSLGDWTVDPDVCTCCQNTVAVLPGDRVFVGYRGHTPTEIRDNLHTTFDLATASWTKPATLRDDGWKIAACPVNGPAADSLDSTLTVSWFTAAEGVARVFARTSVDAGATFTTPVQIDLGRPIGRLETVVLPDRSAVILWLEMKSEANAAGLYARRLFPNGTLSTPQLLTTTSQARTSGFPRAALRLDGTVLVAYTQTGEVPQVRTLTLNPAPLVPQTSLTLRGRAATSGPGVLEFCIAPTTTVH
jgi:hypothetical protein